MIGFISGVINNVGWALVWMPIAHFVLSAIVGLLVYLSTLTILSHGRFGTFLMEKQSTQTGFSIHRFSLGLALLLSLCVHILEDYTINIF